MLQIVSDGGIETGACAAEAVPMTGRKRSLGARFICAALCLGLGIASAGRAQVSPAIPRTALLLEVDGAIGPATTEYLRQGFEAARERNAAVIILRMDTPGGLDASMREIVRGILASPVPVITYVSPSGARAASAGTYILYASHLAAMAPGTNLGAATPVQLGGGPQPSGGSGENGPGETPRDASTAKAVNDAAAYLRGLAELRERNADWAEKAVRESASLSAGAALEQGVVEIVAADVPDLLAKADQRRVRLGDRLITLQTEGLEVVAVEPGWRVRLLATITNPNIAYILMLVGVYGIIFEFLTPGTIFSGVIGAICLIIGLFALNLLPINYAGLGLAALGIGLMIAEAFAPSFGILGIGGVIAFAIGSLFLFDDVPGFALSLPIVLAATLASGILLVVAAAAALRSHRRAVVTGDTTLVGSTAVVLTWSDRRGEVRVHGERWQALSAVPLSPDQHVRVIGREKLVLFVEPEPNAQRQP